MTEYVNMQYELNKKDQIDNDEVRQILTETIMKLRGITLTSTEIQANRPQQPAQTTEQPEATHNAPQNYARV